MPNVDYIDVRVAMRELDAAAHSRLITQPPRTQSRLKALVRDIPNIYQLLVRQVDEVVTQGRLTDAGKAVAPTGDLAALDPDGDVAREQLARPLLRRCFVDYKDVNGQPWQLGQDTPVLDVELFGGAHRHEVPSLTDIALRDEVARIAQQADPDEPRRLRLVAEHDLMELHMAIAIGLDEWVKKHDGGDGAGPRSWTALALDVTSRITSILTLKAKGLACVDRPTSERFAVHAPHALVAIPGYSAYPGGHAAIVGAYCVVLAEIGVDKANRDAASTMANEIAANREIARLHTGADTKEGKRLGAAIGKALLSAEARAQANWDQLLNAARAEWA